MIRPGKIKVLHIIPSFDTGGAERLVADLALNIDRETFDMSVLCFMRLGEPVEKLRQQWTKVFFARKRFKFDPWNLFQIWKIIRRERPDIVHTHLGGDIYGRICARLAGVRRIVSTEHNTHPDEGPFMRLMKGWTEKLGMTTIAISDAVRKDAMRRYGITEDRIPVIYNGIDLRRFSAAGRGSAHSPLVIGSVGRLAPQKGFPVLIKAMKLLENENCICRIAGQGADRDALEKSIKDQGLSGKVSLVGVQRDVDRFYASLDIFVLPSIWEGLGLVVLEAGAAGLPVVATDIDGISEIIEDGQNGLLFTKGDAPALADCLRRLAADAGLRSRLGNALSETVRAKFSLVGMIKDYESLYKNMMASV